MPERDRLSSRIPGFFELVRDARLDRIAQTGLLSDASLEHWQRGGALDLEVADAMTENVVATHGLPLSIATNFRVNGRDVLVPMAVEEPSVVAAASNAARLVRLEGGFVATASPSEMTGQIQLDDVLDCARACERIEAARDALIAIGNESIASVVARGGGCTDLETRVIDAELGLVVVHVYVDVVDAMGANIVDTVAEAMADEIARLAGGRVGLRILSNLPLRRMVEARARVGAETLGGAALTDAIVRASRFAEKDPFRAVTHNKGVMNGVDAVALAAGQDWRAIEAGAHAYASLSGVYRPLATWARTESGLEGTLRMPLAVGIVGGSARAHAGVRATLEVLAVSTAAELATIMASVGLASNFAALRALAGEGIQRGHMKLHARKDRIQTIEAPSKERGA